MSGSAVLGFRNFAIIQPILPAWVICHQGPCLSSTSTVAPIGTLAIAMALVLAVLRSLTVLPLSESTCAVSIDITSGIVQSSACPRSE